MGCNKPHQAAVASALYGLRYNMGAELKGKLDAGGMRKETVLKIEEGKGRGNLIKGGIAE
jgi:hypothetical protein